MKAITFSYDDGVTQDQRLIKILDKYHLKGTFNLNTGLMGKPGVLEVNGRTVAHVKASASEIREIYRNHEVAAHTVNHPLLPLLSEEEIIREVVEDRQRLSELVGYEVVGMAYPCGGQNNDERVAKVIQQNTSIQYSRTITSSYSFDMQNNMFRFNPTVYHIEKEKMLQLAQEFLDLRTEQPQIFYIWGHSYEFDAFDSWEWFDEFCALISGRDDIFYGTNEQVFKRYHLI